MDLNATPQEGVEYEVQLGETFEEGNEEKYHTLLYSFKPASVESKGTLAQSRDGENFEVEFSNKGEVTTTFFQGSYFRSTPRECILIFDPETGKFIIERLSGSARQLKTKKKEQNSALFNAKVPDVLPKKRSAEDDHGRAIVRFPRPAVINPTPKEDEDSSSSSGSESESSSEDDELKELESAIEGTAPTSSAPTSTVSPPFYAPASNLSYGYNYGTSFFPTNTTTSYSGVLNTNVTPVQMVQYGQQPTQPSPVQPVVPVQLVQPQPVPQPVQQLPTSNDEESLFSDPEAESSSSSSSSSDSEPENGNP